MNASLIILFAGTLSMISPFSSIALAEEPSDRKGLSLSSNLTLPPVVVEAEKISESANDPPAFFEVIELEDFEGQFKTTPELLSQVQGVVLRDFGGLGALSTVSIRGASSDQVVVLIDGVRINPASGGGLDFSTIPPEHLERIEITRGGESAFYGEGAVGGVVNLVTKKARQGTYSSGEVSYGSYDTLRISTTHSRGKEKTSYLVSGNYLHSDGNFEFINNNGTEFNPDDDFRDKRRNNEIDSGGLLAKAGHRFNRQVNLQGQTEFFAADKGIPGTVTAPSLHVNQRDFRNLTTLNLALSDIGTSGLSSKTLISHRYNATRFEDSYGEQTADVPVSTHPKEYSPGFQETLSYLLGTHQILTLDGLYRRDLLNDEDFGDPRRTTWAVSFWDQITLGDDRITLVPALRYDDVSDAGDQWSPKLGVRLLPRSWLVLKVNGGRSFRAPTFTELYFNRGVFEGNPDLKPERALNFDSGFQLLFSSLTLEGAYFRNEVEDLIVYIPISLFRFKPFNIGEALLEGFEGALTFAPTEYFSLSGNYTFTEATDQTDGPFKGKQIPGRPEHKAFVRSQVFWKTISVFGEFNFIDGNYITRANTKLLDEREIFNAGVVVSPVDHIKVAFELKNLTDEQVEDVRGFPLPGRSYFGTIKATF